MSELDKRLTGEQVKNFKRAIFRILSCYESFEINSIKERKERRVSEVDTRESGRTRKAIARGC